MTNTILITVDLYFADYFKQIPINMKFHFNVNSNLK